MNVKRFVPVVLLALFQMCSDPNITRCPDMSGRLLLMLHHALAVYILLGGYVSDPRIHLLVVLVSFTVHYKNKRLCPITVVHNRMCGFPKKQQLKTILNVIEPDTKRVVCLYYFFLMVAVLYDVRFLLNKTTIKAITKKQAIMGFAR